MRIPLFVVIVGLIAVVAITSTVIVLVPMQRAGLNAVRQTIDSLRLEIRSRLAMQLSIYFAPPTNAISTVVSSTRLGLVDPNDPYSYSQILYDASRTLGLDLYTGMDDGQSMFASVGGGIVIYSTPPVGEYINGTLTFYVVDPWTERVVFQLPPINRTYPYVPATRPWYPPLHARQSWSNLYVNYQGMGTALTFGGPLMNPITNVTFGVVVVDILTSDITKFLLDVVVAKTGRVVVLESATRAVLGGNWNESAVILVNTSDPLNALSYRLADLSDFSDPLLRRTVAAIGENNIFTTAAPFSGQYGSGLDTVYVDIVRITDPNGLDMRMMIMIPQRDYMEKVAHQGNVSIGIVCGAVLAVLVLAFLLTYALLRPLSRVEQRMYASANLEDNGEAEELSVLSEVANIQLAYSKLQAELKRIKSYLPKSVLARLETNSDDDDEPDDEATGKAASASQSEGGNDASMKVRVSKTGATLHESSSSRGSQRSSQRSHGSSLDSRCLFVAEGVKLQRITLLVINLVGFHAAVKDSRRQAIAIQSALLSKLDTLVKKYRGVIDGFQGDHALVTFNAVTSVASHQSKAALTAVHLVHDVEQATQAKVTVGVATGEAVIGNMGIEGLKRFGIVGEVYTQAHVLERLCKLAQTSNLVSTATASACKFEMHVTGMDVVRLPGHAQPTVAYTVRGAKVLGRDEWMYVLEKGTKDDPTLPISEGFERYAAGDLTAARALAATVDEGLPGAARLKQIVAHDLDSHLASMGTYYNRAFLTTSASQ